MDGEEVERNGGEGVHTKGARHVMRQKVKISPGSSVPLHQMSFPQTSNPWRSRVFKETTSEMYALVADE
jgi:hypothetical protein